MLPSWLVPHITDLEFWRSRAKVTGYMWGGSAKAEVHGVKFHLLLWFHGNDEEDAESIKRGLSIQFVNDLDVHWHCIIRGDELWFHEAGWFSDKQLREKLFGTGFCGKPIVDDLASLGFVRLIPPVEETTL